MWSVVLGSVLVAVLLWSGPSEFPLTMDESESLFTDFTDHYLPMARQMPGTWVVDSIHVFEIPASGNR